MHRCLIADDQEQNLYLLEVILKSSGYEVECAANGAEALEKARRHPPDMVISDILMPVMDGYTLCREWKSDNVLKNVPFVFYTATYTEPKDEEFALSLGADRFIVKPQEPDVLIRLIREVLDESYSARQVEARPLGEEMEIFRQHNEILFRKLEKKMSDLEAANRQLRILEEKYRLSFEHATDVIYTIDADLVVSSVSPCVERVLGYKPEEFVGRPLSDLKAILTPESFERAAFDISMILRGDTIEATVYQFIAKDGCIKHGEVSRSPIRSEGKIIGIVSIARDITERKRAEEALRESETKYRHILEDMDDAYFELDLRGDLVFFNEALVRRTGYTREELTGMNYRKYVSPETSKLVSKVFLEIYKTGQAVRLFDYEVIMKDGQIKNYESWANLLSDEQGRPAGFRGMARDITNRKQAEMRLQESLENLRKALGTTIQVLVATVETRDPYTAGHQVRVADLARNIALEMGLPPDRIEGIRLAAVIHDIGKLYVPTEILTKPTRLREIEFALIREHAQKGYEILKDVESAWPLAQIVYQHHERMDGSGYPRNLKGDEIILEARILAVSDVVESMASHRPYRPTLGIEAALEEIERYRGTHYDEVVVDACLKLFREKGYRVVQ
ncbi:MAG: PAS domain S-box protein [Syntrophaceae bacterium]|nr:PAS domain S-box protein [Syntrophaceae bacterium]